MAIKVVKKNSNKPSRNGPRPRGRAKVDIAIRLRAWGWYWLVKNESGKSDDQLDADYVHINADVRPRLFFQIRTMGSSPTEHRGYRERKSLYEKVHAEGAFQAARDWYESDLWQMLCVPKPPQTIFSEFVERTIRKNGWFREPAFTLDARKLLFKRGESAFSPIERLASGAAIEYFMAGFSLEDVAMLASLFREAYENLDLVMAPSLKNALEVAQDEYCRRLNLPPMVRTLFNQLILDRIIQNKWVTEDDAPKSIFENKKSRKDRLRAFVRWYVQSGLYQQNVSRVRNPIVPVTPRLLGLEKRWAEVSEMMEALTLRYHSNAITTDKYENELLRLFDGVRGYLQEGDAEGAAPQMLPSRSAPDLGNDIDLHRKQRADRAREFVMRNS